MKAKSIFSDPYYQLHEKKYSPRFNKVVLLDDSEVDIFINETILKAVHMSRDVVKETSPVKLLRDLKNTMLLSEIPEIIFLDMNMPEMRGIDFLTEFAQLSDFVRSKCKIVIITSTIKKDVEENVLLNPSVVRFLTKPLDVYQLRDFID